MPMQRLTVNLIALCLFTAMTSQAQQIAVNKDNRTIAVTTSAEATADADRVTVEIGFHCVRRRQDSAYAVGSNTSNAIAAALNAANLPRRPSRANRKASRPCNRMAIRTGPQPKSHAQIRGATDLDRENSSSRWRQSAGYCDQGRRNLSGGMTWSIADQDALQAKSGQAGPGASAADRPANGCGLSATLGPIGIRQQ